MAPPDGRPAPEGRTTWLAGSAEVVRDLLTSTDFALAPGADLVVVPTAAAFTGVTPAVVSLASALDGLDVRVEGVMVADRASAGEEYFARRVAQADVVVLGDGSPLHARSVWRDSAVGAAIDAARTVLAIGAVAGVLGDVMIDPRGGAPTTGLGFRPGPVVTTLATPEQLARTRALLGDTVTLVVLGPAGALCGRDGRWRVVRDDVVVTRGGAPVEL